MKKPTDLMTNQVMNELGGLYPYHGGVQNSAPAVHQPHHHGVHHGVVSASAPASHHAGHGGSWRCLIGCMDTT